MQRVVASWRRLAAVLCAASACAPAFAADAGEDGGQLVAQVCAHCHTRDLHPERDDKPLSFREIFALRAYRASELRGFLMSPHDRNMPPTPLGRGQIDAIIDYLRSEGYPIEGR